jgi:ring-1,2-phenylacetyl-CoA epoxidase subunit PaaC
MNTDALKNLLYRMADDDLILGHRNSEWTGFGPILEEDIAFASIAQDQIGHALAYYHLLTTLGEAEPDQLAFHRKVEEYRCCQLVEWPNNHDYAFSLVRHFLYDHAKRLRIEALRNCSYAPLAELAIRIGREVKYHTLHADTWVRQLGTSTEEARLRLQSALNEAYPMALGIFEPTEFTDALAQDGVLPKEAELQAKWHTLIEEICTRANLKLPTDFDASVYMGGRRGYHSEHLAQLVSEMTEVFSIDTAAIW